MIEMTGIEKRFKEKVIFQRTNFSANPGEITLLIGKSGAGKSTLLNMIAGLQSLSAGTYYYQGQNLTNQSDEKMSAFRGETIGFIPQDFALIEDYTVEDNILLPLFYHKKVSLEEARQILAVSLKEFDLESLADKKVLTLSGGQKQRVAIIRSIIDNPQILLADEPTTNLDAENYELVRNLLLNQKERGTIVIVSSHDDRMREIADRTYKIESGKLVLQEPVLEI